MNYNYIKLYFKKIKNYTNDKLISFLLCCNNIDTIDSVLFIDEKEKNINENNINENNINENNINENNIQYYENEEYEML